MLPGFLPLAGSGVNRSVPVSFRILNHLDRIEDIDRGEVAGKRYEWANP